MNDQEPLEVGFASALRAPGAVGGDALGNRIRAEIVSLSTEGHDRDCALAMLSQADSRFSSRLDAVQVAHLLAIGYRAGKAAGRMPTRWWRGGRMCLLMVRPRTGFCCIRHR